MSTQKQIWTLIHKNLNADEITIELDEGEHHYAFHVLRLAVGTVVEIVNGNGLKAVGTVVIANKKQIQIQIDKIAQQNKFRPEVHVWLACPKPGTLEEVISSASELGVHAVHLFKGEKSAFKAPIKIEKLHKNSMEAMRISKSAFAADIFCYENLADFYGKHILNHMNIKLNRLVLLCDESHIYEGSEGKKTNSLFNILQENFSKLKNIDEICVLIGPEASFSDAERTFLDEKLNPLSVSLGSNILRVPTAVVCAVGIIINALPILP